MKAVLEDFWRAQSNKSLWERVKSNNHVGRRGMDNPLENLCYEVKQK